jgi:hypothetical protein
MTSDSSRIAAARIVFVSSAPRTAHRAAAGARPESHSEPDGEGEQDIGVVQDGMNLWHGYRTFGETNRSPGQKRAG